MIRIVARGMSTTADAYLTPVLREYIDGFFSGFDESLRETSYRETKSKEQAQRETTVEFMRSDGGLTDVSDFSGLKSIRESLSRALRTRGTHLVAPCAVSGPAGGVVGYALTSWEQGGRPVVGLDMGSSSALLVDVLVADLRSRLFRLSLYSTTIWTRVGGTSTDVSRFDGEYEVRCTIRICAVRSAYPFSPQTVFETTTAGITVMSPQLSINTVAAGGGSRLFWRNGMFVTGPESAGSHPGESPPFPSP